MTLLATKIFSYKHERERSKVVTWRKARALRKRTFHTPLAPDDSLVHNFTLTLFRIRGHDGSSVDAQGYLRVRLPRGEIAFFLLQEASLQGQFPDRETVTQ